jgi:hypothetical protein
MVNKQFEGHKKQDTHTSMSTRRNVLASELPARGNGTSMSMSSLERVLSVSAPSVPRSTSPTPKRAGKARSHADNSRGVTKPGPLKKTSPERVVKEIDGGSSPLTADEELAVMAMTSKYLDTLLPLDEGARPEALAMVSLLTANYMLMQFGIMAVETFATYEELGKSILAYEEIERYRQEQGATPIQTDAPPPRLLPEEKLKEFRRAVYADGTGPGGASLAGFLRDYYLNWNAIEAAYRSGNYGQMRLQVAKGAAMLSGFGIAFVGVEGIASALTNIGVGTLTTIVQAERTLQMADQVLPQVPLVGQYLADMTRGGVGRAGAAVVALRGNEEVNRIRNAAAAARRYSSFGEQLVAWEEEERAAAGFLTTAGNFVRGLGNAVYGVSKWLGPVGRVGVYSAVSVAIALERAAHERLGNLRAFIEANPPAEAVKWKKQILKAFELDEKPDQAKYDREKALQEAAVDEAVRKQSAAKGKANKARASREVEDAMGQLQLLDDTYKKQNKTYLAKRKAHVTGLTGMVLSWKQYYADLDGGLTRLREKRAGVSLGLMGTFSHMDYYVSRAVVCDEVDTKVVCLVNIVSSFAAKQEWFKGTWQEAVRIVASGGPIPMLSYDRPGGVVPAGGAGGEDEGGDSDEDDGGDDGGDLEAAGDDEIVPVQDYEKPTIEDMD